MLLYYPFWMFMGFIIHFYIIFGTNLLTQSPVPVSVFSPCFSVSQKRNIKRSPNGMKPSGKLFLERKKSRGLGVHVREDSRWPRGREARPTPLGAPPTLVGPLWLPLPTSFAYIYPYTLKTSRNTIDREFRRRKPL